MKSLKKFLKGLMGIIDNDKIENYYGHGANNHGTTRIKHDSTKMKKSCMKDKMQTMCDDLSGTENLVYKILTL